jgi:hypothetical protein
MPPTAPPADRPKITPDHHLNDATVIPVLDGRAGR